MSKIGPTLGSDGLVLRPSERALRAMVGEQDDNLSDPCGQSNEGAGEAHESDSHV